MPARLTVSPLSQTERNSLILICHGRSRQVPRTPELLALLMTAILSQWKSSSRKVDKHNIRWIEAIAGLEDTMELAGHSVLQELEKHDFGLFRVPLNSIASGSLRSVKASAHDILIVREQENFLKEYALKHELPLSSVLFPRWLKIHWREIDQALREFPCHCEYKDSETTWPDISDCRTRKDLLVCLLERLHNSSSAAIKQVVKPSNRKPRSQRTSK